MPRIAVAGAGIGGLAAALALAEVGCAVDVYERAEALEAVGAGVQLSPNAAIVLRRLGVLDALGAAAVPSSEVRMRRARDGAVLARVPLGPAAEARYGAPFLSALRADLQAALLACAARRPAIALHLGRGIEGYDLRASGVALRFAGGTANADALVGADGIRSAVRRQGTGGDAPRASGRSAYRASVPREAADADAREPRSNLWLGPSAHLVHYPVDGGARINVVAIVDEGIAADGADPWSQPAEAAAVERRFAGWAAPARRLIAAAPGWRRWPLFDRPPLPRWSAGPVTLLGDAAHPMLPFLAQGAAQSIEDAAVLADSVSRSGGDFPAAFSTYEALRRPRTSRVQAQSARQGSIYHLGPPLSLARDFVLSTLGPARLAARVDWLYDAPAEVRRFAGP
ncbi:FAD-dependent monooxygenase [Lichenibacterium dinghuense]|uniref:FAD-dependent monooxygenase n=1 Tax=Lichenibacterium dinghuense TaxID=2895977 RepID=UPI001F02C38C|nr:FAD-dependent monooxygenase [Lichenibacterium sp. 6Y81]